MIKAKKVAKKIWETSRRQEDKDVHRQANKAAKKAVATNKALAMNELYEELETPEGERNIFMFAMECATNCTNVAAARLMSKLLTMNSGYRSWYRANFIAVWYARQAIPKRSLRYI